MPHLAAAPARLARIGLVVHPTRDLRRGLAALTRWAQEHGVAITQVARHQAARPVAPPGEVADADLVVAVGGDGTVLAALRAAATVGRPVLGVACGSLGALAAVAPSGLPEALDRVLAGEWTPHALPAATVAGPHGLAALNDLVAVRAGSSQVGATVAVDGVPYASFAGDGLIVSTPLGSSAYTLAAGGPVLAPGTDGLVLTPLAPHGGCIPPLVTGPHARLEVDLEPGYGGLRLEVDGQPVTREVLALEIRLRPAFATLVRLGGEEPFLTGLRRRGILADSPRMVERARREAAARARAPALPDEVAGPAVTDEVAFRALPDEA